MDFHVQVAHSVKEIGRERWDRVGVGKPFTSYRWYRFGETVLVDDVPVYIVLLDGNEPVARATFWLRKSEPLPIASRSLRSLIAGILRRWPLFICQSPLTSTSGLILPPPPHRDAALELITSVARTQGEEHQASFLLCPYLERAETSRDSWPRAFTFASLPNPGTRMIITWRSFEEYLDQLPKSARKDYRRHRNRAQAEGIEVTRHSHVEDPDKALVLIRKVEASHKSTPNPWARAMLEHSSMVDATWLVAHAGQRVAGCGLLLGDGPVRYLALLGLDYDVRYAYFQLVYEAIRCAIEDGVQILRGGSGAYDLKARLGFEMESNNNLGFVGRGPGLEALGRWLCRTDAVVPVDPVRQANEHGLI